MSASPFITFADIATRVDDDRARRFQTRALASSGSLGDVSPLFPYGLPPPAPATAPPPAPSLTVDQVKAGLPNLPLPWRGAFRAASRAPAARRGGRRAAGAGAGAPLRGGAPPAPLPEGARRALELLAGGSVPPPPPPPLPPPPQPPAAALPPPPLPPPDAPNWGLSAFGWWLLGGGGGAVAAAALPRVPVPPAAAALPPAAAAAAAQRAAGAALRAAGPTALPGGALPGWGDAAFFSFRGARALPPLRCLGLAPPPPQPPPPPPPRALAVCVRGAGDVVEERAAVLGARGVALRAARARTELLRSADFLSEAGARALLASAAAAECGGGGGGEEGAEGEPAAAAAGVKRPFSAAAAAQPPAERRLRLVALAQAGALPQLQPLRITPAEAAALGLGEGAAAYAGAGDGGEEDEDPLAGCRRAVPQPALPRAPPPLARLPSLRALQLPAATLLLPEAPP
jgi:hypothetical protein